jgi:hypothetical protein
LKILSYPKHTIDKKYNIMINLTELNFPSNSSKYYNKPHAEVVIEYHPNLDKLKYPTNLPEITGLKLMEQTDIELWMNTVLNGIRVATINGKSLHVGVGYNCDICQESINDEENYYYCLECYQDICEGCYGSDDETLVNALNISIVKCRNDHIIHSRCSVDRVGCDLCNSPILDEYKFCNKPFIPLHWNTYDLCMKCSTTDEGIGYIQEKELLQMSNSLLYNECVYDNFADWIPIYKSDSTINNNNSLCSVICMNLNTESKHYKKISIAKCSNGYYDTYVRIITLNKSIKQLANLINSEKFFVSESNEQIQDYDIDDDFESTINDIDINMSNDVNTKNSNIINTIFDTYYKNYV